MSETMTKIWIGPELISMMRDMQGILIEQRGGKWCASVEYHNVFPVCRVSGKTANEAVANLLESLSQIQVVEANTP